MTSSRFVTGLEAVSDRWVESSAIRPALTMLAPAVLVMMSIAFRWDIAEPSGLLAGAALLAGAMVNTLLRVWAWADENDRRVSLISDDPLDDVARSRLRERINALERVQAISAWAVLTSIGLVGSLIVLEIKTVPLAQAAARGVEPTRTSVVVLATAATLGLGCLLLLLFLSIIAETVHVAHGAVDAQRAVLGAKSGASERDN